MSPGEGIGSLARPSEAAPADAVAIDAVLDHVAVAVPSIDAALLHWRDELGGGLLPAWEVPGFVARQLRYANGGKVELIEPPDGGGGFVGGFLERFGSGVQHVTVKVEDLDATLDGLRAEGFDVVDEDRSDDWWHEAFLRPSQVGGLVVQVAWTPEDDDEWAERTGAVATDPAPDAVDLLGPLLGHPDPASTHRWWSLLGAVVTPIGDGSDAVQVRWPGSALDVVVQPSERAGPLGVRLRRPNGHDGVSVWSGSS